MTNKPKKIIPLLLVLLGLASHSGLAQSENPPKWELGTDLLFLFDKNQLPDYSLFATRKLGDKGYALRSRIGFSMEWSRPQSNPDTVVINDGQSYNYLVMIGLEREFSKLKLSKGTSFYWALDAGFSQNIQTNQGKIVPTSEFLVQESSANTYAAVASVGIKQSITPSLTIRLETSLSNNFTVQKTESFVAQINSNSPSDKKSLVKDTKRDPDIHTRYVSQSNFLRINPFSQLLLTLKF